MKLSLTTVWWHLVAYGPYQNTVLYRHEMIKPYLTLEYFGPAALVINLSRKIRIS